MIKYVYIALLVTGCAVGSSLPDMSDSGPDAETPRQYKHQETSKEEVPMGTNERDGCVPDRFASNNIPPGYRIDPDCPPMIYDPAKWIPPWDPSPVIQEKPYVETN